MKILGITFYNPREYRSGLPTTIQQSPQPTTPTITIEFTHGEFRQILNGARFGSDHVAPELWQELENAAMEAKLYDTPPDAA